MQVAVDEPLTATAVQPVIGVPPSKNSMVPVGVPAPGATGVAAAV